MEPFRLVPLDNTAFDPSEALYRQVREALEVGSDEPLVIDLSTMAFVRPAELMTLVTAARLWHRETGQPTVLTQMRPNVHCYLERIDVFTACGEWIRADPPLDPSQRWNRSRASLKLLELKPIAAEEDQNGRDVTATVNGARRVMAAWFDSDERAIGSLCTIISEIASNVVHSRDRGFAMIQHHNRSSPGGQVTVGVADLGVGIEASLRSQRPVRGNKPYQDTSSGSAAIMRALELGVTSRDKVGGMGLHLVKTIVDRWHGVLTIRSGRSWVRIEEGEVQVRDGLEDVPGVQVTIQVEGSDGNDVPF